MKLRMGFVSNSSSSSFCMYGIECSEMGIGEEELIKLAKSENQEEEMCIEDALELICQKFDMSYIYDCDNEMIYLGRSPLDILDDETGKQFKDDVRAQLIKLFPAIKVKTLDDNIGEHSGIIQC